LQLQQPQPIYFSSIESFKQKIMNANMKFFSASFIAVAMLFTACTKDKAAPEAPADNLAASLLSGNWVVSSLVQRTEDKTSQFSNIVFTFSANNTVKATDKNGTVTNGTWNYTPAVTYYGATSKEAMVINLGTGNPFNRITKTWNVTSKSTSVAKFDNPEVLEDEHLQFSKQ
jgi:hypothetical protein